MLILKYFNSKKFTFSLLLLLTSIIGNVKVPNDVEKKKDLFKMNEKPELMKHFSSFMLDMLLLPYVHIR